MKIVIKQVKNGWKFFVHKNGEIYESKSIYISAYDCSVALSGYLEIVDR